ncbi:MAG: DNA-binding response regulator, partial [Verrucomicrobia bacterium]
MKDHQPVSKWGTKADSGCSGSPQARVRRIAVVDDHALVRDGVGKLIDRHPGWTLCGEGRTGKDAIAIHERERPDVIILDFAMPDGNGLEATRAIVAKDPEARIIMITGYDPESVAREATRAGVKGLILKTDAGQVLEQAIETVLAGGSYFSSSPGGLAAGFAEIGLERKGANSLSSREKEIIGLIGDGLTSKEIGGMLGISARTVETHRANIMRKLNMRSVV